MSVRVAGGLCVLLACGHTFIGHRWILPRLPREALPPSPFGGPSSTAAVLKVTWDVVTIAAAAMGVLLIGVAGRHHSAERSLVLYVVASTFAANAATAIWLARGRPGALARGAPVWMAFLLIAVLCVIGT